MLISSLHYPFNQIEKINSGEGHALLICITRLLIPKNRRGASRRLNNTLIFPGGASRRLNNPLIFPAALRAVSTIDWFPPAALRAARAVNTHVIVPAARSASHQHVNLHTQCNCVP